MTPEPTPRGAFGYAIDIQDDIIVVGECWAEVEEQGDCGRLHVFKLGAPVEVQIPIEDETTQVSDEPNAYGNGGIPGYPLESLVLGLASVVLISYLYQRKR